MWNDELAQVAQTYSESCVFQNNADRTSQQTSFSSVGENLGITSASMDDYDGLFESWLSQRNSYNFTPNTCSSICGQYTQVGKVH